MRSRPVEMPVARGAQRPRICWVPEYASSTGAEAIELCRLAGLILDPWQEFVLDSALGEDADGNWSAFEVGVEAPRQNGKNGIIEGRELAGLFLLGERLIIHSAHEFATSLEAFRRLLELIESTPEFVRHVKRVSRAHGEEGIELLNGQRIRFRTRTKGGGRGFTGDCVILDEAMELPDSAIGALMPTVSARPNPQIWYTGSAVDQEIHENGVVFARVRERALRGNDPALAYFGWSPPLEKPDEVTPAMASDPDVWAQANPALGIRITEEHVAREQRSMAPRTFAVERLGVGDWPSTEESDELISHEMWSACADEDSEALDPVTFAFDVTPDRSRSAIGVAGERGDGLSHIEVTDHRAGTAWVVDRAEELLQRHGVDEIYCDANGPAGSLVAEFERRGITVVAVSAKEHTQACGLLFDGLKQKTVKHQNTAELTAAARGAATRTLGEAWAWSRKSSFVDISPLVSCTIALWGSRQQSADLEPLIAVGR